MPRERRQDVYQTKSGYLRRLRQRAMRREGWLQQMLLASLKAECKGRGFFKHIPSTKYIKENPDIIGCFAGRHVALELKVEPNTPTPGQKRELEAYRRAGGFAATVVYAELEPSPGAMVTEVRHLVVVLPVSYDPSDDRAEACDTPLRDLAATRWMDPDSDCRAFILPFSGGRSGSGAGRIDTRPLLHLVTGGALVDEGLRLDSDTMEEIPTANRDLEDAE